MRLGPASCQQGAKGVGCQQVTIVMVARAHIADPPLVACSPGGTKVQPYLRMVHAHLHRSSFCPVVSVMPYYCLSMAFGLQLGCTNRSVVFVRWRQCATPYHA